MASVHTYGTGFIGDFEAAELRASVCDNLSISLLCNVPGNCIGIRGVFSFVKFGNTLLAD